MERIKISSTYSQKTTENPERLEEVLRRPDVNFVFFHQMYNLHMFGIKNIDLHQTMFFQEFNDEPDIKEILIELFDDLHFRKMKTEVGRICEAITFDKLTDDETSYEELANLTEFVSTADLLKLVKDNNMAKKIRFSYIWKLLEPHFLQPVGCQYNGVSISQHARSRVLGQCRRYLTDIGPEIQITLENPGGEYTDHRMDSDAELIPLLVKSL